ncbi:SURF1 family cytochrome oxidase biogenesis protein [Achromobacter xylosoxidans]
MAAAGDPGPGRAGAAGYARRRADHQGRAVAARAAHVRAVVAGGQDASSLPERLPLAGGAVPQVQNLPLDAYAKATGLTLLPTVVSQFGTGEDDGLVHDWPQPSVNFQQNTVYAVEWFSFALFAAIAWLVVLGAPSSACANAPRPTTRRPDRPFRQQNP